MSAQLAVDPSFITIQIRKFWNGLNYQQRSLWVIVHELPLLNLGTSWDFDDLPTDVQDALFCEFLDNAERSID